jgi:hypothetical protein|tara:strand:- start:441 stop:671 length:231 start_codon:yes stop_codon:yes gene_type:complete
VFGEDDREPIAEPGMRALADRLRVAVGRANLGASRSWPIGKQASHSLRLIGAGGRVSLENPSTVRRAITILENYRG